MSTLNTDFKEFGLPPQLVEGLTKLGFSIPTPIQMQSIPAAMAGKDVLAIAPTGTGKTGAFGIPALANIATQTEKQLLVLAPTRELAAQIFKFLSSVLPSNKVRGALLVGGESIRRQYFDWTAGVDYIVATPGRLMDHVGRGLDLKHIGILVLDEVDRMLDMGFAPQIEEIVKTVPVERQTLFFSATMPPEIQKLVARYLKEPVRITVGAKKEDAPKIREERIQAKGYEKIELLHEKVKAHTGKILVFTRTQMFTDRVAEQLEVFGIEAARLHGGRTQAERTRALDAFRRGRVRVLVATDIAARGIDVADIEVVINFDRAATQEDHTHRIGRTGRCGKEGLAITFIDGFSRGGDRFQQGGRPSFQGRKTFGHNRDRQFAGNAPDRASAPRFNNAPERPAAPRFNNAPERPAAPRFNNPSEAPTAPRFSGASENGPRPRFNSGASRSASSRFRPPQDRNAQAMADSNPKNFGRSKPPRKDFRTGEPFKKREVNDGVSGSVRYFRNKDTQPGFVKRKHVSAPPVFKQMKPSPGLARGKKGAVRRPAQASPAPLA